MPNVPKALLILAAILVAGCQNAPEDQNIIITDNSAGADIEAVPADEGPVVDDNAANLPANDAAISNQN